MRFLVASWDVQGLGLGFGISDFLGGERRAYAKCHRSSTPFLPPRIRHPSGFRVSSIGVVNTPLALPLSLSLTSHLSLSLSLTHPISLHRDTHIHRDVPDSADENPDAGVDGGGVHDADEHENHDEKANGL